MLPQVIIFNQISLDGAYKDIEIDMDQYYSLAAGFKADTVLIGSRTANTGAQMGPVPPEEQDDFRKPQGRDQVPYAVIVDTTGHCQGMLHVFRRFEFIRDVIVLVSAKTPKKYLNYLKERCYDTVTTGEDKVDLKRSLEILTEKYQTKIVRVDSGPMLGGVLIEQGLVSELSLLISPQLQGKCDNYFQMTGLKKPLKLELIKEERVGQGYLLISYRFI